MRILYPDSQTLSVAYFDVDFFNKKYEHPICDDPCRSKQYLSYEKNVKLDDGNVYNQLYKKVDCSAGIRSYIGAPNIRVIRLSFYVEFEKGN